MSAAIVTDQFRILNARNFIDSVLNETDNYYTFLGLPNPTSPSVSIGRSDSTSWDNSSTTPSPIDNLQYSSHYRDISMFGKKITTKNIRRVVKKTEWKVNKKYDMYRHDYSITNRTPNSDKSRLYDSSYFVVNSDYRVYICLDNGSFGVSGSETSKGNNSQDEPLFTDLEPSPAGTSGDGYIWKYLFTIPPSDIIKFDSTEYIVLPNDWDTTTDPQISNIRESADSNVNLNQIKKVYIEKRGSAYIKGTHNNIPILGDGSGAKVSVTVNDGFGIESIVVTSGGSGYTYGIIDLGSIQRENIYSDGTNAAKLIPIIPPSIGHGYDIYSELGADKVLVYTRFDNSTRDFPIETKFSQVGIIKNPMQFGSTSNKFTGSQFSSLSSMRINSITSPDNVTTGKKIEQTKSNGDVAKAYVASYDKDTQVLKYFTDRSLIFNNNRDQTDYTGISKSSKNVNFESSSSISGNDFSADIDSTFGASTPTNEINGINLGVTFTNGLADPEINKKTGDIIYINNRPTVTRDARQKEDVKIILEF